MFAEKIYMRKYFEIDSKEFPPKLVDLAYEEARAALRNDFDAIAKTQQQVQTFWDGIWLPSFPSSASLSEHWPVKKDLCS